MEGEHLDRLADDIEANGLHEPTAFVLSANVHRRNLSTGQRAMAVAMLRPAPEKRGRGNKSTINGDFTGAPQQRIADARAVLNYSPELMLRPEQEKGGRGKSCWVMPVWSSASSLDK